MPYPDQMQPSPMGLQGMGRMAMGGKGLIPTSTPMTKPPVIGNQMVPPAPGGLAPGGQPAPTGVMPMNQQANQQRQAIMQAMMQRGMPMGGQPMAQPRVAMPGMMPQG